jgi:hypothetical protein
LASEKEDGTVAIAHVCNKFRLQLSELFGVVGFRTLLHRSLVLTRTETNCFENVSLDYNGALLGLAEAGSQEQEALMRDGGVVLITNLLMLLEIFVGEAVTQILLDETWPNTIPRPVTSKTKSP